MPTPLSTLPWAVVLLLGGSEALSAAQPALSPDVQRYVRVQTSTVILTHVRIIDGTGAPSVADRNVVIQDGKIVRVEDGGDAAATPDTTVLDLHGYSVMPGIVGMHNHLYYIARGNLEGGKEPPYEPPLLVPQMTFSAPRLPRWRCHDDAHHG